MTDTTFPQLVKQMRDNLLAHCEYAVLNAKVKKAAYDAYVKEGFTAGQALTLVKGT
jgi:hypothetical protein